VPKVYVERNQLALAEVFTQKGWNTVQDRTKADLIVLMGGADIASSWYNQQPHPRTGNPLMEWDNHTANLIEYAWENKIPLIGICRGAQFINAVSGGSMYQHVDGHQGNHSIVDISTGQVHTVNSIHHQAMIPHNSAEVVAVTTEVVAINRSLMRGNEVVTTLNTGDEPEVEALYYHHTKSLCFQAHPEYDSPTGSTRSYFYKLCERFYPELFPFTEKVLVA
jgi:gamma-glutamyl-gamma-aminobutyrate hydrolase PuuD